MCGFTMATKSGPGDLETPVTMRKGLTISYLRDSGLGRLQLASGETFGGHCFPETTTSPVQASQ